MRIAILGSLIVRYGAASVTPTATKPRTVLALLAANANVVVPVESLVGELWPHAVPRTAKTTVQTYVLHLRRLIAAAVAEDGIGPDEADRTAKQLLATLPCGYVLNAAQEDVDVLHFERLAAQGHRARETGDAKSAAAAFAEALSWWRDTPLLDVHAGPRLTLTIRRLEEMWLNVLDCRIDADLLLGRHHGLLGELTALVSRYPMHEGLSAHLMLALYRSGRSCEALDVYHRLRAALGAESGIEPSPQLRRLYRSMLVSDRLADEPSRPQREAPVGPPSTRLPQRARVAPPERISAELAAIPWDAQEQVLGSRRTQLHG